MKKILTIVLSLVLILSSNCVIFAEDDPTMGSWDGTNYTADTTNNSETGAKGNEFDVTATITKDDGTKDDTPVYCVDIAWSMSPAAYKSAGDSYVWDPTTLKYVKDSENLGSKLTAVTENATVSITVTNKSNADVKYDITYKSAQQSSTDISEATQTTTNKESGTLTSAASGVTPTLTASPDDTVATGTATSATYTATVALKKSGDDYIATQSSTDDLVMGTYTVKVKKAGPYSISYEIEGTQSYRAYAKIYTYDGVNTPTLIYDETASPAPSAFTNISINTDYLIVTLGCNDVEYECNLNANDACFSLIEERGSDHENSKSVIKDLSIEGNYEHYYLLELVGSGTVKITGEWDS